MIMCEQDIVAIVVTSIGMALLLGFAAFCLFWPTDRRFQDKVPCICGGHMCQRRTVTMYPKHQTFVTWLMQKWGLPILSQKYKTWVTWCSNPRCGNGSFTSCELEGIERFLNINKIVRGSIEPIEPKVTK